ncbi:MAG: hypothetical protein KDD47_04665 [Acidobacteria bacterium]|nr:hypothetical protein [Acidobacteriota bacterium]
MPADFDPARLLAHLVEHELRFIVVGGVAAILHGSPLMTEDLDVVYSTQPENLERLSHALSELKAIYRDPAGRRIQPDLDRLVSIKTHLLKTEFGSLDLLKTIGPDLGYHELLEKSAPVEVEGVQVHVVDLEQLIEAKELAGRPKDRIGVLYLRELLDRRSGQS